MKRKRCTLLLLLALCLSLSACSGREEENNKADAEIDAALRALTPRAPSEAFLRRTAEALGESGNGGNTLDFPKRSRAFPRWISAAAAAGIAAAGVAFWQLSETEAPNYELVSTENVLRDSEELPVELNADGEIELATSADDACGIICAPDSLTAAVAGNATGGTLVHRKFAGIIQVQLGATGAAISPGTKLIFGTGAVLTTGSGTAVAVAVESAPSGRSGQMVNAILL